MNIILCICEDNNLEETIICLFWYLPMVLTLSEDREGGGVEAEVFMPTLSEDLQRDTSVNRILKRVVHLKTICKQILF